MGNLVKFLIYFKIILYIAEKYTCTLTMILFDPNAIKYQVAHNMCKNLHVPSIFSTRKFQLIRCNKITQLKIKYTQYNRLHCFDSSSDMQMVRELPTKRDYIQRPLSISMSWALSVKATLRSINPVISSTANRIETITSTVSKLGNAPHGDNNNSI